MDNGRFAHPPSLSHTLCIRHLDSLTIYYNAPPLQLPPPSLVPPRTQTNRATCRYRTFSLSFPLSLVFLPVFFSLFSSHRYVCINTAAISFSPFAFIPFTLPLSFFFIFGDILDETPDKYLSRHIYIRPTLHDSDSDSLLFSPFFSYF